MTKPEILAPGGSIAGVYSAINAGCDAIYIGGKKFGARAFADNPDDSELVSVINDVHFYNRKIYITINTILNENDFRELYSFLELLYKAGADAVIVQDLGVLNFIHREFPDFPVHASTQMNITQGSAANLLKKYGVTRIVPARELSFSEIAKMRAETDLELEVFVQGALCYSHSGQCLMSSLIGGRSGNKGACAQPCRKLYNTKDYGECYLLSLKDLCTLNYIPELIEAGIDSYKIEGRMKKPEYAAITTHLYRKYVDLYFSLGKEKYIEEISHSEMLATDIKRLKDIYNRGGFTCGYLTGSYKNGEMLSKKRPGHNGIIVGRVCAINNNTKTVKLIFSENVSGGDILEIRDNTENTLHEHTIKDNIKAGNSIDIKAGYNFKAINKGCDVVRVRNEALISKIKEEFPSVPKKISVSGEFTARLEGTAMLCIWPDESPEITAVSYGGIVKRADKKPAGINDIISKIKVSGDACFKWEKLIVSVDSDIFLPPKMLKEMRRQAFDILYKNIVHSGEGFCRNGSLLRDKNEVLPKKNNINAEKEIIAEIRTKEQFMYINNEALFSTIYVHIEDFTMERLVRLLNDCMPDKRVYAVMPRIFRYDGESFFDGEFDLNRLSSYKCFAGFVICNLEEYVYFIKNDGGRRFDIRCADNMYVRNSYAYDMLINRLGISLAQPSIECFEKELLHLAGSCTLDTALYKRVQAMVTAIPMEGINIIKDSYGNSYRVLHHSFYGYSDIYHYEPYDIINEDFIKELPVIRISFTFENEMEIRNVIDRLRKRLE